MSMSGYTKLFSSIVTSTVWCEPDHVRLVWITMLALSDRFGIVEASIPGLADMAHVSLENCQDALRVLAAPDTYSRTKEFEGRRITETDGGWQLINHAKYRNKLSADERRVYNAQKQKESRDRKREASMTVNDEYAQSAHTEAEATPEAEAVVQEQDQDRAFGADERAETDDRPKIKVQVLTALARSYLKTVDLSLPDSELAAQLKDMAAKMQIPYDSRSIQKALDSARKLS